MTDSETVPESWSERIDACVADGDVGAAVDKLRHWTADHEYTAWAFERLGRLLLDAGFRRDAGRALFWAGVREEGRVAQAIEQFLGSVKGSPQQLLRTLPRRARTSSASWPEVVRREAEAFGVTPKLLDAEASQTKSKRGGLGDLLGCAVGVLVVVSFLTGVIIGAGALWRWLFGG